MAEAPKAENSEIIQSISVLAAFLGYAALDGNPMYGSWRATDAMAALSRLTQIPSDILFTVAEGE